MGEKLVSVLVSSAMLLVAAGVELVSEENYVLGALLIVLGLACVIVAMTWSLPKTVGRQVQLKTGGGSE